MLNRNAEAATEFQKILDPPGLVAGDPIGALAHLQLGRAYSRMGNASKAKSDLSRFLDALEKCRSEHLYLETGQSRVRQAVATGAAHAPLPSALFDFGARSSGFHIVAKPCFRDCGRVA